MSNAEINVKNEIYIRIWGPTDCIEMNEAHDIQKYIPNSLAIGDDEGGIAIIYRWKRRIRIIYSGFGNLDIEETIKIAPSLKVLLIDCVGVGKLLYS